MDPNYISELAKLFRNRGEQVLSGEIKFSVSGHMLRALNDSFSLIVNPRDTATPPGEKSRDFIVCPAMSVESRSTVFLDLQLIYDFVQILVHVHITHLVTDDDLEASVDLINFRNLQKLEIQKLPVQKLVGLRRLRGQLRELSCQQCLARCQDVLLYCGGDRSGEQVWNELRSINFSYNALEQIDDSVRWTPWVHTLNLSHNRLTVSSLLPLKFLPNLKFLDLSFNKLTAIPELGTDALRKLLTLRARGNAIEDISEVANFEALMELDLSGNCLLFDLALMPISELASLRVLNLSGNPMAFNETHRRTVIKFLHSNTSTVKFILNGSEMTRLEKKHTGAYPSYHSTRRQSQNNNGPSSSLSSSVEGSIDRVRVTDRMTDSAKKRSKVREIILGDDLNDADSPIVVGSPRRSLSARKKLAAATQVHDHLEMRKQIEELRDKFGHNWLNADGENIVKEVFPRTEHEDDLVRRQILIDELNDDSVLSSTPKEGMASRLEITDNNLTSTTLENYGTASEREGGGEGETSVSGIMDGTSTAAYESALSKDPDLTGLDFFQTQQSMEEDAQEPNEVTYHVEKLKSTKDQSGWKLLLVVSDLSLKEKDPATNELIHRWGLTVVESCERPNRNVISIHFNTMRSDKKQRNYLLQEEKECLKLTDFLRNVLANRNWDEFNQSVYRCANCATQFCVDKNNLKAAERVQCPENKSHYVIEITEQANKIKNPIVQKVQSQEDDKAAVIVKSNSHSSIGSAASLNESSSCSKVSNPPTSSIDSNESVAGSSTSERDKDKDLNSRRLGMESDVEILSNPSQSSIEVLNTGSKSSSRKHSRSEDRRSFYYNSSGQLVEPSSATQVDDERDAEQALEATNVAVANKLLGNCQLQTLTESSSSGSITESVCTQYEQVATSTVEEHKPIEFVAGEDQQQQVPTAEESQSDHEVGFKKSNSTFFEGFLNASNILKNLGSTSVKTADGIRLVKAEPFVFSTVNFQQADHRLHLYLHQNVFLESSEKFKSVIRMAFFDDAGELCQSMEDAIVVLSNRTMYLFFVTAEEDDDPAQWLRLMRRVDLKEWTGMRILPFGMGLRFSFATGGGWNAILEDGQHTRNYLKAIAEMEKRCDEEMAEEHKRKLIEAVGGIARGEVDGDEEKLIVLSPFKRLEKTVNEKTKILNRRSALLVTNKTFALLSANWKWLAEGPRGDKPEVLGQLSVEDMVRCEILSDTMEFELNFLDDQRNQHELWRVQFETKYAMQAVIDALKAGITCYPWEDLLTTNNSEMT